MKDADERLRRSFDDLHYLSFPALVCLFTRNGHEYSISVKGSAHLGCLDKNILFFSFNYYECIFEFDSDWGSLTKTAVFVGENVRNAPIESNKCRVPVDILEKSGEVYIGVYGFTQAGENSQVRISTNLIPFECEEGAYRVGEPGSDIPPLDVWEIYQAACNEYANAAKAAQTAAQTAQGKAEDAQTAAETAKNEAVTAEGNAKGYAGDAEKAKKAAEDAATKANISAGDADYAMQEARNSEEQAIASATAAERHKIDAQGYAEDAQGYAEDAQRDATAAGTAQKATETAKNDAIDLILRASEAAKDAMDASDIAIAAKDNAEASVEAILQEGESFVRNYGEQYINGQKTFVEKTILTEIGSYNAKLPIRASEIEIEAFDGILLKSTNGNPIAFRVGDSFYGFYDNGEFGADKITTKEINSVDDTTGVKLDGKPIATEEYVDNKVNVVTVDTLENIKRISTSPDSELIIDGTEILISPRGSVTISSVVGSIDFTAPHGQVTAYGKPIATKEFVNEALKDVEGGSITIDDVPTEGSTNAVSSGGVYECLESKKIKTYLSNVDGSDFETFEDAKLTFIQGEYDYNGTITEYPNPETGGMTDFVEVNPNQLIKYLAYTTITSFSANGCIYDSDKKRIGNLEAPATNMSEVEMLMPAEARYIRLNYKGTDTSKYYVKVGFSNKTELPALRLKSENITDEFKDALFGGESPSGEAQKKYGNSVHKPITFGTRAVAFGDSITAGVCSDNGTLTTVGANAYIKLFCNEQNLVLQNRGWSGSYICDPNNENSICNKVLAFDFSAATINTIFIAGGCNDYNFGKPLGVFGDTEQTTFYGALKVICEHLKTTVPDATVIFITPINQSCGATGGATFPNNNPYRNAIFEVATSYGFNVVDGEQMGFPIDFESPYKDFMIHDGVHPTTEGHKMYARNLSGVLL